MSKIGVFGGTFNPPHLAHKRLITEAIIEAKLDKVIVIPTNIPPHKISKDLLDGEDRLKLCDLTFYEKIFEVSDLEISRSGKSYTVETLELLKRKFPDDELFLIIGSDMLLSFHQWFRYNDILKLAKLIVLTRENEIDAEELFFYSKETLHIKRGDIIILNLSPVVLSSTEIRDRIKKGLPVGEMLSKDALQFIKEKGFYK